MLRQWRLMRRNCKKLSVTVKSLCSIKYGNNLNHDEIVLVELVRRIEAMKLELSGIQHISV
jgi:hypothetical protein